MYLYLGFCCTHGLIKVTNIITLTHPGLSSAINFIYWHSHLHSSSWFQPSVDPFMCGCAHCDAFWWRLSGRTVDLDKSSQISQLRASAISSKHAEILKRKQDPLALRIGDRVLVKGKYKGGCCTCYTGTSDCICIVIMLFEDLIRYIYFRSFYHWSKSN